MLQMENTGLKKLDPYFLQVTGMWNSAIFVRFSVYLSSCFVCECVRV